MSHIVEIKTQIRDAEAFQAACRRRGLPAAVQGSTRRFSGTVTGLAVQLPGWHYPAVCQLDTGQIKFDNYGGAWKGGENKPPEGRKAWQASEDHAYDCRDPFPRICPGIVPSDHLHSR